MRFLLSICCIAAVVGLSPAFAQNAPSEGPASATEDSPAQPATWAPSARAGRISLVAGNVDLRRTEGAGWADAELNQPIFPGDSVRTDPRARSELRIGSTTIGLQGGSEIGFAVLRDGSTHITVLRGRLQLHLRHAAADQTVEIDFPQGAVWLTGQGIYDIDASGGDRPARLAVFQGTAHFLGAGTYSRIEEGQAAVLPAVQSAAVTIEPALPDEFVEWCREQDYDETSLAALYYAPPEMTGVAELDPAGVWKIDPDQGPVWFPADLEWAPYRFGHWSWIAPWGWNWIDDRAWAFAPSHYGRWVLIREHWAWSPGSAEQPTYAPAVVAFLGTPGVGLSSEEGAAVAWFPLAPGEAYWPIYSRDLDYVRSLNHGNLEDIQSMRLQANGEPPLESFTLDFANREFATVVPRSVFIGGRPAAPARITIPEHRLQNAPVLIAPQIAPPSAQRIARAVSKPVNAPPDRVIIRLAKKGKLTPVRSASIPSRSRAQPMVIRGVHLHTPSYAGQARGRQAIVLRAAYHTRAGGRGAR